MKTFADPFYTSGAYLNGSSGKKDAAYKVAWIKRFLQKHTSEIGNINNLADIGCGSGDATILLADMIASFGFSRTQVYGYDLHPEIDRMEGTEKVKFVRGDFLELVTDRIDMVFLLDVIEHVVGPQQFLSRLSEKAKWIVLHIPLDDTFFTWYRNLQHGKIVNPGHISVFDPAAALNLV